MNAQRGITPLHYAAEASNSAITRLLLDAGANVMIRDKVSSCVAILRHLNDVCYHRYGKHAVCYAKFFDTLWCLFTHNDHAQLMNIRSTIDNAHQRQSMHFSEAIMFSQ